MTIGVGTIIGTSESCYNLLIDDIQSTDPEIRVKGLSILNDIIRSSPGIAESRL